MCILFLVDYPGCGHSQYIGGLHCPGPYVAGCQRIYRLEDDGYQCRDCVQLHGIQLDTDANPVINEPCTQGYQNESLPQPTFEDTVRASRRPSPASLSDIDSETSHWKLDVIECERDNIGATKPASDQGNKEIASKAHEGDQVTELTPQTARHRDLVQQQLADLANHISLSNDRQRFNDPLQPKQYSDAHSAEENEILFQQQLYYGFTLLQQHIESATSGTQTQNLQPLRLHTRSMLLPENYFPPPQATPKLFVPGHTIPDFAPHKLSTAASPSGRRPSKSPTRRSAAPRSPTRGSPTRQERGLQYE